VRRSDYNTHAALQLGRQLTVEERKLLDHYRLHEGVTWKEAAKRLQRRELALAQDAGEEDNFLDNDGEPDFSRSVDPVDPTDPDWQA
jgi:hypothetical protein